MNIFRSLAGPATGTRGVVVPSSAGLLNNDEQNRWAFLPHAHSRGFFAATFAKSPAFPRGTGVALRWAHDIQPRPIRRPPHTHHRHRRSRANSGGAGRAE